MMTFLLFILALVISYLFVAFGVYITCALLTWAGITILAFLGKLL